MKNLTITQEQLQKLSKVRKDLIELYNENKNVNYFTVRDLDDTIEEIFKTVSNYQS